jgi:hypothetical protein
MNWEIEEGDVLNCVCLNRDKFKSCNSCDNRGKLRVKFEDDEDLECENSSDFKLKILGTVIHGKSGVKMNVDQVQSERKQRSKENFKKEIFPTFKPGSDERNHFRKKYTDLK